MIGKIEKLPLREIWKHEAYDFTTWLEENIDTLESVVGFAMTSAESERRTENFSVDIVAEDNDGRIVVIENQLEKSDHDHLGKLITYLTAVEANRAIWIVSEPRTEHVKAIAWLNESTSTDFYLIKLEAIKIGDSSPAPLFTEIVGPSEEAREIGETKKDLKESQILRKQFWAHLLDYAKDKTNLHSNISPGTHGWIGTGAGKTGLSYNYNIRKNKSNVELYIDRGKDSDTENELIFEELRKNKEQIEESFGEVLSWEKLEEKRACRIAKYFHDGGYSDEENWNAIISELVDSMIRLEKALRKPINSLNSV
jgi:hypothetical protein